MTKSAHPSAKKRQKEEFRLGKFIVFPLAVAKKESFGGGLAIQEARWLSWMRWASQSCFRRQLEERAKQGNPQKARKFHLTVSEAPPRRCREKGCFGSSELAAKRRIGFR